MAKLNANSGRVIIALTLAAVGVGVAWRALQRSAPATAISNVATPAPEERHQASYYEIHPQDALALQSAARELGALIQRQLSGLEHSALAPDRVAALADRVSAKVILLFSEPSMEEVRTFAAGDGATTFPDPGRVESEEELNRLMQWPELWRMTPFSVDRAFVRQFHAPDGWVSPRKWQRRLVRHRLRPRVPMPPEMEVVEVVVPVLARRIGAGVADVPADLGLSYRWDDASQSWKGVNTTLYLAGDAPGGIVPPP